MKKLSLLFVMMISMLFCSVASAGFNLNNLLLDPASKQEVQRLSNTYVYPMSYVNGVWTGVIKKAEKNDYNKLVELKKKLNNDNEPTLQDFFKNSNIVVQGGNEKGAKVPEDLFNKYRTALKNTCTLYYYAVDVLGNEDKPTRNLTQGEIDKLNVLLIDSAESMIAYIEASSKLLGKGSVANISSESYRKLTLGNKYIDFVWTFMMPGTLVSSEQKMVNGNIQKVDTYQWKKGKSSVNAVFENGKAISIVPQNLK